jgi:glycosyltransferase involved in cell wall biosynthesis
MIQGISELQNLDKKQTKNDIDNDWLIYHLVQPYFFAHHHFHIRKIKTLRAEGFSAWALAFVPDNLYIEHQERYQKIIAQGFTKIVRISSENKTNQAFLFFLLSQLIFNKKIVIHILRNDPSPVIRLRQWPIFNQKIRYVLEYEGDMPSEFIYQAAYLENPRPPILPPSGLKSTYDNMLNAQINHVSQADGLVLMSHEHIKLWETRLGKPVTACWLPSLADPNRIFFDQQKRKEIRKNLGLSDRIIVIYTGNVFCKWQRLDSMCQFVAQLATKMPKIWFMLLVRQDDLEMAREAISKYDLEYLTTIKYVTSDAINDYLSAADIGLFLRHIHPMNLVVTSAKLGEYLAAGLPVITTGANAEVLNEFIRETSAGVFLDDCLPVSDQIVEDLNALVELSKQFDWRTRLSKLMAERFGSKNDPYFCYAPFIREIIEKT